MYVIHHCFCFTNMLLHTYLLSIMTLTLYTRYHYIFMIATTVFASYTCCYTYINAVYPDLGFMCMLPQYIYATHHCFGSWTYCDIYINDVYPCLGFICMLPLCMYRPSCRLLHEHAIMHIYMLPMALVLYTYCPCIYMLSTITFATYICCLLMFPHHICLELTQVDWLVFSTSCKRPIADFLIHQKFRISHILSIYLEKALIWPYCQKRKVGRNLFVIIFHFKKSKEEKRFYFSNHASHFFIFQTLKFRKRP